jgi:hypothetical protein
VSQEDSDALKITSSRKVYRFPLALDSLTIHRRDYTPKDYTKEKLKFSFFLSAFISSWFG